MKTFHENPTTKLSCVFIKPEELSLAFDRLVSVCTDVIFVDQAGRFVLAYRKIHSAYGWWWKGGSKRKGETDAESLSRLMKREIGFVPENIFPLDVVDHYWETRQEAPQEHGKHDELHVNYVEVDEETIAKIKLDPSEYDAERGFMRYDGSQDVRSVITEMFRRYHALKQPEVRTALEIANQTLAKFGLTATPFGLTSN